VKGTNTAALLALGDGDLGRLSAGSSEADYSMPIREARVRR